MKKLMSLSFAACVLSLTSLAVAPGVAAAAECPPGTAVWNQDPMTVGVAGRTVHTPGFTIQACTTKYGSVANTTQLVTPRIQPSTCAPSLFDPACFSVYLDTAAGYGVSNVTVAIFVDGVQQGPPISVDIPQHPFNGQSVCVLSVGYRAAPTHNCLAFVDLGQ